MLKGIPKIISPELLKVLMEMGHGDELVIGDGNFPAAAIAPRLIRADGHGAVELLDAILKFFPLDQYDKHPVTLMAVVPGDDVETPIWDEYRAVVTKHYPEAPEFKYVERFAFYEKAKQAYAVLATGEAALYANVILKKGVVVD
ncbi:MAG: L-fucose mutarotase [Firmicutes bacterium]|nr:L-fucose mutarotase [Bacillota bacterium]